VASAAHSCRCRSSLCLTTSGKMVVSASQHATVRGNPRLALGVQLTRLLQVGCCPWTQNDVLLCSQNPPTRLQSGARRDACTPVVGSRGLDDTVFITILLGYAFLSQATMCSV